MTTPLETLMARAKALKLHGLLAHWEEVAAAPWVAPLLTWEEDKRAGRGLERRLGNAHLGRFKPLADFDWQWPTQCDRTAIDDLMGLRFLAETANVVLVGPNGVGESMICSTPTPPCPSDRSRRGAPRRATRSTLPDTCESAIVTRFLAAANEPGMRERVTATPQPQPSSYKRSSHNSTAVAIW